MNIEIKPFIHQICFTPQLVWRPLKKKFRLAESCHKLWLPDGHSKTNPRTAETAGIFQHECHFDPGTSGNLAPVGRLHPGQCHRDISQTAAQRRLCRRFHALLVSTVEAHGGLRGYDQDPWFHAADHRRTLSRPHRLVGLHSFAARAARGGGARCGHARSALVHCWERCMSTFFALWVVWAR